MLKVLTLEIQKIIYIIYDDDDYCVYRYALWLFSIFVDMNTFQEIGWGGWVKYSGPNMYSYIVAILPNLVDSYFMQFSTWRLPHSVYE